MVRQAVSGRTSALEARHRWLLPVHLQLVEEKGHPIYSITWTLDGNIIHFWSSYLYSNGLYNSARNGM